MKVKITNAAKRPYYMSYYDRGKVISVLIPPGDVRVNESQFAKIENIELFKRLLKDKVLSFEKEETTIAVEKPKAKKTKKVDDKKSANVDLESL